MFYVKCPSTRKWFLLLVKELKTTQERERERESERERERVCFHVAEIEQNHF